MGYLKIIAYVYLAAAVFFIYMGFNAMQNNEDGLIYFIFGGIGVFMFFFRLRYAAKLQKHKRGNR